MSLETPRNFSEEMEKVVADFHEELEQVQTPEQLLEQARPRSFDGTKETTAADLERRRTVESFEKLNPNPWARPDYRWF